MKIETKKWVDKKRKRENKNKNWKKCLGCGLWNCFMQLWYEQRLKLNYIRSLKFISLIKIYFVQVYIIIIIIIYLFIFIIQQLGDGGFKPWISLLEITGSVSWAIRLFTQLEVF